MTVSPPASLTLFDALIEALRRAAAYNSGFEVAPAAVLWPDRERRWEALLPRLREALPLYTLGSYDAAARSGPAYWLRSIVTLEGNSVDVVVDLRLKPRDAATSLLAEPKAPRDGRASLLVEDHDREGGTALVVVLTAQGAVLAQALTVVGG